MNIINENKNNKPSVDRDQIERMDLNSTETWRLGLGWQGNKTHLVAGRRDDTVAVASRLPLPFLLLGITVK